MEPFEGAVDYFKTAPSGKFTRGLKDADARVLGSAMSGGVTTTMTNDQDMIKKFPEWTEPYLRGN